MIYVFYYLVALTIFCNVMCLFYAVLIARSRLTDTMTWTLFAIGFGGRLLQTLWGLARLSERYAYYTQFGAAFLLQSVALETCIYLIFLTAMWRKYHAAKTRI